ncbi:MAG: heat shock protein HtpX, partial [Planctomycetaceae bacterium]|nr:heat shock protein HtpX [Planctomycetaceae bacterium]
QDDNGWVVILAGLTSLLIWLTRRVLWCLMVIGHVVSCVLLRQMEYDADKFEARLAGSEVFESTTRRITELNLANVLTHRIVVANQHAGLPDDLPLCLSKIARTLPPEIASISDQMIADNQTGWFDSHPADRDRIKAAHNQQAPGIFQLERPAKVLLEDYAQRSKNATLLFYKRFLRKAAIKQQLTPTETFLSSIEAS